MGQVLLSTYVNFLVKLVPWAAFGEALGRESCMSRNVVDLFRNFSINKKPVPPQYISLCSDQFGVEEIMSETLGRSTTNEIVKYKHIGPSTPPPVL